MRRWLKCCARAANELFDTFFICRIKWKQNFWTALLLKCDNVDKYLKLFYKFMDIPDNRMATMKTLIQRGRQEMPLLEHLSGEKFGSLTKSIFAYKTENTT